jgi:hypothetical protein
VSEQGSFDRVRDRHAIRAGRRPLEIRIVEALDEAPDARGI